MEVSFGRLTALSVIFYLAAEMEIFALSYILIHSQKLYPLRITSLILLGGVGRMGSKKKTNCEMSRSNTYKPPSCTIYSVFPHKMRTAAWVYHTLLSTQLASFPLRIILWHTTKGNLVKILSPQWSLQEFTVLPFLFNLASKSEAKPYLWATKLKLVPLAVFRHTISGIRAGWITCEKHKQ